MQVQVDIDNNIWDEYVKYGINKTEIEQIAREALRKHISKIKNYQRLLNLAGKVEWEGNLDELRAVRS